MIEIIVSMPGLGYSGNSCFASLLFRASLPFHLPSPFPSIHSTCDILKGAPQPVSALPLQALAGFSPLLLLADGGRRGSRDEIVKIKIQHVERDH